MTYNFANEIRNGYKFATDTLYATQDEARADAQRLGLKYNKGRGEAGKNVYIPGFRVNGVSVYRLVYLRSDNIVRVRDEVPGATRKLSITDRAVQALIKGQSKEQIIATLVAAGATPESARCTAHFVVTGKVSKAHAAMIATGKWVGYSAR